MTKNRVNYNQDMTKLVKNKCTFLDKTTVREYLSSYVKSNGLITTKRISNDHLLKYINKPDPFIKTNEKIRSRKVITKQALLQPEGMIWKLVANGSGNTWILVSATKQDVKAHERKSWS